MWAPHLSELERLILAHENDVYESNIRSLTLQQERRLFQSIRDVIENSVQLPNAPNVAHAIMCYTMDLQLYNDELRQIFYDLQSGHTIDSAAIFTLLQCSFGDISKVVRSRTLLSESPYYYARRRLWVELVLKECLKNSPFSRGQLEAILHRVIEFCNTPAPRNVKNFREEIGVALNSLRNNLTTVELEQIVGSLDFVAQQGSEAAILARALGYNDAHQEFHPLSRFDDFPTVGDKIAKSHFGPVREIQHPSYGPLAVKIIELAKVEANKKRRKPFLDNPPCEIQTHYYLTHGWEYLPHIFNGPSPFICKHIGTTMDKSDENVYYYMERGVDYFSMISDTFEKYHNEWKQQVRDGLIQQEAQSVWEKTRLKDFSGLLAGVKYMHLMNIAHRDFKLENVVSRPEDGRLMIIDFGVAHRFASWEQTFWCWDRVGTGAYMSPECMYNQRRSGTTYIENHQRWDARANDMWTLGLALFSMCFACKPYQSCSNSDARFVCLTAGSYFKNREDIPANLQNANIKMLLRANRRSSMLTTPLLDLLKRIFVPAESRITIDDIIDHEWVREAFMSIPDKGFEWPLIIKDLSVPDMYGHVFNENMEEEIQPMALTPALTPMQSIEMVGDASSLEFTTPQKGSSTKPMASENPKSPSGMDMENGMAPEWFRYSTDEDQKQMYEFYKHWRSKGCDENLLLNNLCEQFDLLLNNAQELVSYFDTRFGTGV